MKVAIFDTETTGLLMPSAAPIEKQPHIIELGGVVVDETGEIRELSQLLDPQVELEQVITKITGIKPEDLQNKPTFEEFLPQLREFFDGTDVFMAHNAPFDSGVLRCELERLSADFPWPEEIICTVQEYTPQFGHRPKMTELYEKVMGKPLLQTHRALDDVRALDECTKEDGFLNMLFGIEDDSA